MAKKEQDEEISWGTWEELLLACAVKRHGTNNWESVANEINKNSSSSSNFVVTPHNCKHKYHDLLLRFTTGNKDIADSGITDPHNNNIDELRKLRVAELRREVQQYDDSIVSLQLKVKRLKEERDRSLKEEKKKLEIKPDLVLENTTKEEGDKETETEPVRFPSPIEKPDKPVSGGESDREDSQSYNESNSSDLKDAKNPETEKIAEPVQAVTEEKDVDKPLGENSWNGSSETRIPARETRETTELWESVAESKGDGNGGEEGTKENSDVQSSASLSRRNRRTRKTSGSSSGEERETEEVSPAIKQISVQSEPLVGFLEMVLSHKSGKVFQSRLEGQQTSKYKGLIRQHIDMESIQARLKEGSYSGSCSQKFFRDLLLLFNNAIAFYPKHSSESVAATELRELVSKEISSGSSGSSLSRSQNNPSSGEPTLRNLQQSAPPLPKPETELSAPLLPKLKSVAGLIIPCRKRSSMSLSATNSSKPVEFEGSDQKIVEEKPVLDKRQKENSPAVEPIVFRKRKGERSTSGTRSSRSNFKNHQNNSTNKNNSKNTNSNPSQDPSSAPSSAKDGSGDGNGTNLETKTGKDKKNNSNNASTGLTNTVAKKGSVASFLNRMKTSSSSNKGKLLETLKNSSPGNNSNTTKGERRGSNKDEKHQGGGGGGGSKKDTRQSSSKRQAAQESSPTKRGVGRPPKKAPEPPPSSKRTREKEKEVEQGVKPPRKRTRR
ncbi:hypothetical protein MKW94_018317 [Papaver nudicaule]|uniref:Bromo domain-containing protein n=1 Tax=Papaver nudicaule TaxID=74823 RepID=A0AA41VVL2_PAPNU|nr:hypothetical protein [Papaver nudicaule]